ncbi:hypothetical protein [Actinoplanes sp. G11-F43]|uniref:hypothetical protein n=1 Tax=Actinoplanes sp. G11-F43 TaxID=3424130 RepID=UPI003D32D224
MCLLWLRDDPDQERLAVALAGVYSVPVESVDVCGNRVADRNWRAPVLCTVTPLGGDLRQHLDIYLAPEAGERPSYEVMAADLAGRLGSAVAYQSAPSWPDAFWLVGPDGKRTRAVIHDDEVDEEKDLVLCRITAAEYAVDGIPGIPIMPIPEVIPEYRMPTPLADRVRGDREIVGALAAWESLVTRLERGWPPDGWYPADYYRDHLGYRDELTGLEGNQVLAILDRRFTDATVDDGGRALAARSGPVPDRWWWHRITRPLPWDGTPGEKS